CRDRRGARPAEQQGHLPEPRTRAQPPDGPPGDREGGLALARGGGAVTRVALAKHALAGTHPHSRQPREDPVELSRVEPPEEGQRGERGALVGRRADARRDLIAVADPTLEVPTVERPQLRVLGGTDGRT